MKSVFIIIGLLIAFQSKGQEGHYYFDGDTLIFTSSEFLMDPFQFGVEPLLFLKKQSTSSIDTATFINRHVDNQIDTLFTFKIGKDVFQVFKNQSENFLVSGIVFSNKYSVQKGIITGMKKNGFVKNLIIDFNGDLPDHIKIRDLEFMNWIDFTFQNQQLSKISFTALTD